MQAAALVEWHLASGASERVTDAWHDAVGRGSGWKQRAEQGRTELLARYPHLMDAFGANSF